MATFKHNKKRNSGLLYEFLVRQMASEFLANDVPAWQRTFGIVRKYFGEGQPLAEERQIFETVRYCRGLNQQSARRVIEELQRAARKLNRRLLEIKKNNLIKEINHTFGKDFFSAHRVPEYRLLATIQMLVDSTDASLRESVRGIELEESLVKYMTSTADFHRPSGAPQVDSVACALAARRFRERYGNGLNREQKTLLESYILYSMTGNAEALARRLDEERNRIGRLLCQSVSMDEFKKDSIMAERLNVAIGNLRGIDVKTDQESRVQEIMLYQKLAEELRSDG
jgi:hypothetical protein